MSRQQPLNQQRKRIFLVVDRRQHSLADVHNQRAECLLWVAAGSDGDHIDEIAEKHNLKVLAKLPVNPKISAACDKGMIELFDGDWLDPVAKVLEEIIEEDNK